VQERNRQTERQTDRQTGLLIMAIPHLSLTH